MKLFIIVFGILAVCCLLCSSKSADETKSKGGRGGGKGKIRSSRKEDANKHPPKKDHIKKSLKHEDVAEFVKRCAGGKCKQARGKERKALVKQLKLQQLLELPQFLGDALAAETKANRTLDKVLLLKKAIYRLNGLPADILPADDGLFAGEVILSEDEVDLRLTKILKVDMPELLSEPEFAAFVPDADSVLPDLSALATSASELPADALGSLPDLGLGRRRRSAMFFDSPQVQAQNVQWRMPVPFFINFEGTPATTVRSAISEITSKTGGCVSFVEQSTPPSSSQRSFVIVFETFSDPSLCGMSTTGRRASNVVYLNFNNCKDMKGRAIHEILHVLGATHHHNRLDRDAHVTVQWRNVDSGAVDFYALDDRDFFTSFGTPYDYGSVMHYDAWAGAINADRTDPSTAAMVPVDKTIDPGTLGQRAQIGCSDIELLKKMYCCKSSCVDSEALCGAYANQGSCDADENWFWMEQNCPKSCQICCEFPCANSCVDFCTEHSFGSN